MSPDPRFAHPIAFWRSLYERGWLVAAESITSDDGEGMTVVRYPASMDIADLERLARADEAVISGLLSVRVRPWHVVMTGS
ncbi:hypothetical protein [Brachybacterium phenoliresistens]|uniref:hypothetical protein n=1 Tax=Brachybacterium phenoliresistens TaxID=396014 RepID=UPI0031DD7DD9